MPCPNCSSENIISHLRVDMDTFQWIDTFTCGNCNEQWTEWSEPMIMADQE